MKKTICVLLLCILAITMTACTNTTKTQTTKTQESESLTQIINCNWDDAQKTLETLSITTESIPSAYRDSFFTSSRFTPFDIDVFDQTSAYNFDAYYINAYDSYGIGDGCILTIFDTVYAFGGITSEIYHENVSSLIEAILKIDTDNIPEPRYSVPKGCDDNGNPWEQGWKTLIFEFEDFTLEIIAYRHTYDDWQDYIPLQLLVYCNYKELCYEKGMTAFNNHVYDSAVEYFDAANDYDDARDKFAESCRLVAEEAMKEKDHLTAFIYLEKIYYSFYWDDEDLFQKYLEACYLTGCDELENGQFETAAGYFKKASEYNYGDSQERYYEAYYRIAEKYAQAKDYTNAIKNYKIAEDYSNAQEMIVEMNYLYGKELIDSGNLEASLTYFENCRGYKDTDDIVNPYYYDSAMVEVNLYLECFGSELGRNYTYENSTEYVLYCKAVELLKKCINYMDSAEWLKRLEYIESICNMANQANNIFTATQFIVLDKTIYDNEINISFLIDNQENGVMTLSNYNNFSANIYRCYYDNMKYEDGAIVRLITMLFTKTTSDDELKNTLVSSFYDGEYEKTVTINYGGYLLDISITPSETYHCVDISIIGTKI